MPEKILSPKDIQFGIQQDEKLKVNVGKILEDKVTIITGCSSGLGGATTRTFLEAGSYVIGCYYSKADARLYPHAIRDIDKFVNENNYNKNFMGLDIDISDKSSTEIIVKHALKKFGHIDILCNFAGFAYFNNFENISREEYNRTLDVNLNAHFFLTQKVAEEMKRNSPQSECLSRGSIINMTSITGCHVGEDGVSPYAITKAGLLALTKSLATELGPYKIRVNSISPGSILTPINFRDYKNRERRKKIEDRTSLGRWGFPQEIANVALFLASDLSSYITGAEIVVDGGTISKFQL